MIIISVSLQFDLKSSQRQKKPHQLATDCFAHPNPHGCIWLWRSASEVSTTD